jgi:hypothetical protein
VVKCVRRVVARAERPVGLLFSLSLNSNFN